MKHNYEVLDDLFKENGVEWAVVTKLLCGHEDYLKEVIDLGVKEVCDSRISNLKLVKEINPDVQTVYIKPPAKRSLRSVVKYADVSFNTEFSTIQQLSDEAVRQGRTHKVIIMIELGDLREGIMGDHVTDFYAKIFELPNIEVSGLGANLNCLHGVMPSQDKLIQLCLYKQLIEAQFNITIPWVTGGTSVVVPLLFRKQVPRGINHFRVGEMLYFGNDLFSGEPIEGMEHEVIKLFAEVIEITEKPKIPIGQLEANPAGEVFSIDEEDYGKVSKRAILDLGSLDIRNEYLVPDDSGIKIVGSSSDMIIVDLEDAGKNYQVGDLVSFNIKYMGALGLLNSNYIEKVIA